MFAETATFVSHLGSRGGRFLNDVRDPRLRCPLLTFTDRMFIDLGGKHVELIYTGKNHSDNSLVVLLPQNKLLFAVDFIPVETVAYRTMRNDYPDEWIESVQTGRAVRFRDPCPWPWQDRQEGNTYRMFRGYLEDLRAAVQEQIQNGASRGRGGKRPLCFPSTSNGNVTPNVFPENVEGMYRYLSRQRK